MRSLNLVFRQQEDILEETPEELAGEERKAKTPKRKDPKRARESLSRFHLAIVDKIGKFLLMQI